MRDLKIALIGLPLGHSYSPEIHAKLGDYEYRLLELREEEVGPFLRAGGFDGLNVTIPYKKTVMPFLDGISSEAARIGSVNTILRRPDGTLFGDNTDYYGFSLMAAPFAEKVSGRKVLVLGSGGSSRTVCTVLGDLGANVTVISRTGENHYGNLERHRDAVMIVNTTPVGMFPDNGASPLSLDLFPDLEGVLDLIYNPSRTALILDAEERGIPAVSGLVMLVAQAARSSALFTGRAPDDASVGSIVRQIRAEKENVVLIGMPGCGKSTIGRRLAGLMGRAFVDLDDEIIARTGMDIPVIFSQLGEEAFRDAETAALREISKRSSLVIAAGGGTPLRPENRRLIRQNSTAVFLSRPLGELARGGRPVSMERSAGTLWEERRSAYEAALDFSVEVCPTPDETADAVLEALRSSP